MKNRVPEPDFSDSDEEGKTGKESESEEEYKSEDSEDDEENAPWFPNQAAAKKHEQEKEKKNNPEGKYKPGIHLYFELKTGKQILFICTIYNPWM